MSSTRSALSILGFLAALVLCTCAAYYVSFYGTFVFDDFEAIVNNDQLGVLLPDDRAFLRRPVGRISFTLNYWVWGRDPWSFHLVNLLIHLGAGLILFDLIRRVLLRPVMSERYQHSAARIAFVVAAIWLLHPIQTESVTYIVQRFASLMSFFYLAVLYCILRGAESRWRWIWYALAVISCWLGMGTKQVMVTAPITALLFDRIYLAEAWSEVFRKRFAVYLAMLCSMGYPFLSVIMFTNMDSTAGFSVADLSMWEYLRSQPGVLLHYLRLMYLPDNLCLDYLWPVANSPMDIYPAGLVILALLTASITLLILRPTVGFVAFSFFLLLSITSSVLPIADLAVEHRMYLPLAPLVILNVLAGYHLFNFLARRDPSFRFMPPVLVVLILTALLLRTTVRNLDYTSDVRLWQSVVDQAPHNGRAHSNLARALREAGHLEEAKRHYEVVLSDQPHYEPAHFGYAMLLADLGHFKESDSHFESAIQLNPEPSKTHHNFAIRLAARGETTQAIEHYERALRHNPNYAVCYSNFGNLYFRDRKYVKAIEKYEKALEINPGIESARMAMANSFYQLGMLESALATYEYILRHQPKSLSARVQIAKIRSTASDESLRDGKLALHMAEQLIREGFQDEARVLDALAAAHAEQGEFGKALTSARKALQKATAASDEPFAVMIQTCIDLYKKGQPARYSESDPPPSA